MAPLPAAYIRDRIRHSYEQRLETIWSRPVNRVHVLDFDGLTPEMRHDLAVRLRMVYSKEGQQVMSDTKMGLDVADTLCFHLRDVRRRMTWRRFILALGLHTEQEMAEAGDFLGPAPSYVLIQDPVRRLCHKMIAYSISGRGRHLRRHAEERKSGARFGRQYMLGRPSTIDGSRLLRLSVPIRPMRLSTDERRQRFHTNAQATSTTLHTFSQAPDYITKD
ncbi:hypothetical protein Tco_1100804, partial [Tanacetum coccineum]